MSPPAHGDALRLLGGVEIGRGDHVAGLEPGLPLQLREVEQHAASGEAADLLDPEPGRAGVRLHLRRGHAVVVVVVLVDVAERVHVTGGVGGEDQDVFVRARALVGAVDREPAVVGLVHQREPHRRPAVVEQRYAGGLDRDPEAVDLAGGDGRRARRAPISGVSRLSAPRSSSSPQRPQLVTRSFGCVLTVGFPSSWFALHHGSLRRIGDTPMRFLRSPVTSSSRVGRTG